MPATIQAYDSFEKLQRTAMNLATDTFYAVLLTSGYTIDTANHTVLADVSAHELPNADGYSTGGALITGLSVSASGWNFNDPTWANLGDPNPVQFRYLAIYRSGVVDGLTNPLCVVVLLDDTPADITVSASEYKAVLNANGLIIW